MGEAWRARAHAQGDGLLLGRPSVEHDEPIESLLPQFRSDPGPLQPLLPLQVDVLV